MTTAWEIPAGAPDRAARERTREGFARYLARMADMLLCVIPSTPVLLAIEARIGEATSEKFFVASFVLFGGCWLIEALLLATVGTTPGKWAMGVTVRAADGAKLSFPAALRRGATALALGTGFNIPYVSLAAQAWSFQTLAQNGQTLWDKWGGSTVQRTPRHVAVWVLVSILVISMLALIAVSMFIEGVQSRAG